MARSKAKSRSKAKPAKKAAKKAAPKGYRLKSAAKPKPRKGVQKASGR